MRSNGGWGLWGAGLRGGSKMAGMGGAVALGPPLNRRGSEGRAKDAGASSTSEAPGGRRRFGVIFGLGPGPVSIFLD